MNTPPLLLALLIAGPTIAAEGASVISFNFTAGSSGMLSTDLAGAPEVRVTNWNNLGIVSTVDLLTLSNVVDSTGAPVPGMIVTFDPGSSTVLPGGATGANDSSLFNNFYDQFGAPAAEIEVTNIPFAIYDVYFYRSGVETNADQRTGQFTIGDESRFVRGGLPNPAPAGTGYVLSTDTVQTSAAETTQGNYVVFSGLTSPTLDASFIAAIAGDGTPRNKVVGFQIVQVPEPSSFLILASGAVGLVGLRRRRAA